MSDLSPAKVLDKNDPGDDVIARFKYQFCNVAIYGLRMIVEPNTVKSIICENFEDLILERWDGKFDAVQVKTKDRHLPKLKLTDEPVENSLIRFIRLNSQFPKKFQTFRFVTNHEMWVDKQNGSNTIWVLSELQKAPKIKGLCKTSLKRLAVERLIEKSGCSVEAVIDTMCLTTCVERREDVRTIERAVSDAVVECDECKNLPYEIVLKLADDLISAAFHASAKGRNTLVAKLYAPDANFEEVFNQQSLNGKKIDAQFVESIIQSWLKLGDEPLVIEGISSLEGLPKGLSKMVQKMAKGGVEAVRIKHMTDLVRSFEALKVKWALKYDGPTAKAMVSDLLGRTLTECVEAQVSASKKGSPYGSNQYARMKTLLESKHKNEFDTMYGCRTDHLIGAAGVLTEDCKVWWSDQFALLDSEKIELLDGKAEPLNAQEIEHLGVESELLDGQE